MFRQCEDSCYCLCGEETDPCSAPAAAGTSGVRLAGCGYPQALCAAGACSLVPPSAATCR